MKPSARVWVRLNSVPVIAAARPTIARKFIAAMLEHTGRLKSLDDLEPGQLDALEHWLGKFSNDTLETRFLEHLKGAS